MDMVQMRAGREGHPAGDGARLLPVLGTALQFRATLWDPLTVLGHPWLCPWSWDQLGTGCPR